jgi:hypothetical protein
MSEKRPGKKSRRVSVLHKRFRDRNVSLLHVYLNESRSYDYAVRIRLLLTDKLSSSCVDLHKFVRNHMHS